MTEDIPMDFREITIANWHPTPNHEDSKAEQVHIVIDMTAGARFLIRFKSAHGIDNFIKDLTRHRKEVWG